MSGYIDPVVATHLVNTTTGVTQSVAAFSASKGNVFLYDNTVAAMPIATHRRLYTGTPFAGSGTGLLQWDMTAISPSNAVAVVLQVAVDCRAVTGNTVVNVIIYGPTNHALAHGWSQSALYHVNQDNQSFLAVAKFQSSVLRQIEYEITHPIAATHGDVSLLVHGWILS